MTSKGGAGGGGTGGTTAEDAEKSIWSKLDALSDRYKEGKRFLKELQDHLEELAEAEKQYSKQLAKASKGTPTPGKYEASDLVTALQQWRGKADVMAKSHGDLALALAAESKGVGAFIDAQSKSKKGAEMDVTKIREIVDRLAAEVPKVYSKYGKAAREAEEAQLVLEQAQWSYQSESVIQKLNNVVQQKRKIAQQAEEGYRAVLDEGRDYSRRVNVIRSSVQAYDRIEQERINFIKDLLQRVSNAHANLINAVYDANNAVIAVLEHLCPTSALTEALLGDLQQFEQRNPADDSRFLYIQYTDQLDHRPPAELEHPAVPQDAVNQPMPPVHHEPLDILFAPKISGPIMGQGDQVQMALASTSNPDLLRYLQSQGSTPRPRNEPTNLDLAFGPKFTPGGAIYSQEAQVPNAALVSTTDPALQRFLASQRAGQPPGGPQRPAAPAPPTKPPKR